MLFNQIAVTGGILLAYVIDFGFSGVPGNWHWMFLVGVIPGAALTIGMYFLPESPRWLVSHGRTDEAMSKATIFNWGFNLLVALTFLSMLQTLGQPVTFFIFGGVSIATFFFSYFLVPETRGRSLEEIEAQWQARVGAQRGP